MRSANYVSGSVCVNIELNLIFGVWKFNMGGKKSLCVFWHQAEIKHRKKKIGACHLAPSGNETREKKNQCYIWRQAEIKHGSKKNRCVSFGANRKLNTGEKKSVLDLAPSGN